MTTENEININFFFDEIDDNNLELDLSELVIIIYKEFFLVSVNFLKN